MPGHTKRTEAFRAELVELAKALQDGVMTGDQRTRLIHILWKNTTDSPSIVKAHENEPIFVLRAPDLAAQPAMETWINKVKWGYDRDVQPVEKIRDAEECLVEFKAYPFHKLPD